MYMDSDILKIQMTLVLPPRLLPLARQYERTPPVTLRNSNLDRLFGTTGAALAMPPTQVRFHP